MTSSASFQEVNRFARVLRILLTSFVALAFAASAQAAPTPVITAGYGTSGMAPFTLHVHGLSTTLSVGDRLSALYEWDFGNAGSPYNRMIGFKAAHVFDTAGVYTVRLTVTEETGSQASTTITVNVTADTRTAIYVAANGADSNPGTQALPIRTAGRASQMLGANKRVYFRRGDTFDLSGNVFVNYANVVVGAYGSGAKPVLRYTAGSGGYPSLIQMHDQANGVVVEDLNLTTIYSSSMSAPRGVHPEGQNICVRRCAFSNLSDAMNAEGTVWGFLAQQNDVGMMGGYFLWAQGNDHTLLANTVAGSLNEHNIRFAGCQRVYVGFNDLTNTLKTAVWCMTGNDAYITRNIFRSGQVMVGPNFVNSSASERFLRTVIDGNRFAGINIELYAGAEKVMIRNNVIQSDSLPAISTWGYLSTYNRTVDDVRVLNNTSTNTSTLYGRFLRIGAGTTHLTAINNLYVASNLNTGYAGANAYTLDTSLGNNYFNSNMWATPHNGTAVHFFNTSGISVAAWDNLAQVGTERYRLFNASDLSATYAPQNFNANVGVQVPGVHVDFNGAYRPAGNVVTVGAVELNPSGGTPPPPPPPPPPTGSIVFNMQDGTGWTVQSGGVVDGGWERGVPAGGGLRGDPVADGDGSGACWLTANRPGDSDVDGGPSTLITPAINASQGGNVIVSYTVWFTNADDNDSDRMRVDISSNNGQTWNFVHEVYDSNGWRTYAFRLSDFAAATSQMKLRFQVSDSPNNSITEAALDNLRFCFSGTCATPNDLGPSGDANGDGVVNVDDLIAVTLSWGACACPADLNHDGVVDANDLILVILNWD